MSSKSNIMDVPVSGVQHGPGVNCVTRPDEKERRRRSSPLDSHTTLVVQSQRSSFIRPEAERNATSLMSVVSYSVLGSDTADASFIVRQTST
jgi:hypothetical protein